MTNPPHSASPVERLAAQVLRDAESRLATLTSGYVGRAWTQQPELSLKAAAEDILAEFGADDLRRMGYALKPDVLWSPRYGSAHVEFHLVSL